MKKIMTILFAAICMLLITIVFAQGNTPLPGDGLKKDSVKPEMAKQKKAKAGLFAKIQLNLLL
jgi:hypothetical protein